MLVESEFDPISAATQTRFRTRPIRVYFATINDRPQPVTMGYFLGVRIRIHHGDLDHHIPRVGAGWTADEAIREARAQRRGPAGSFRNPRTARH